jgi:uncharacterized protein YkwD
VHHAPTGPPLSARLSAALRRWSALLRLALRRRSRALALCALLAAGATVLLIAVPVVSGVDPNTTSVALDSSSSTAASRSSQGDSPVRMGVDGKPLPSSSSPHSTSTSPESSGPASEAAPAEVPPASSSSAAGDAPPAPSSSVEAPAAPAPAPAPAAAAAPAPPAAPPAASGVEEQVLALVNQERAAAGCGALVADSGLAGVARAHSADMRDRDFFDHTNPDGLDPFDRASAAGQTAYAENIARGQDDAAAVMASWMDSPGHRRNILDCDLTRLGVGVAEGSGGPWWTQLFG